MHSIVTVVHYCTNEYRFLKKIITEAKKFSQKVIVPICDHFFNGEEENLALMQRTYEDFPDCEFIEFAYDAHRLYNPFLSKYSKEDREWGFFWHSTSRYIATLFAPKTAEYLLFLDSDEIIDGDRFLAWLNTYEYRLFAALRFRSYVYVHRPDIRSKQLFHSALMARLNAIPLDKIINADDRHGFFHSIAEPKKNNLVDALGIPFIHHYPWVRPMDECLLKSQTWGHRHDKNWKEAIARMFQNAAQPMDLEIELENTPVFFDPLSMTIPSVRKKKTHAFPHVISVDHDVVFQKKVEQMALDYHHH